jgi:hypothetical protein
MDTTAAACSRRSAAIPKRWRRHCRLIHPLLLVQVDGMPLTDVLLVNIKLLTLPELKLITDQGADGRRQLSEAFSGPSRLVSSLKRKPVIADNSDS